MLQERLAESDEQVDHAQIEIDELQDKISSLLQAVHVSSMEMEEKQRELNIALSQMRERDATIDHLRLEKIAVEEQVHSCGTVEQDLRQEISALQSQLSDEATTVERIKGLQLATSSGANDLICSGATR